MSCRSLLFKEAPMSFCVCRYSSKKDQRPYYILFGKTLDSVQRTWYSRKKNPKRPKKRPNFNFGDFFQGMSTSLIFFKYLQVRDPVDRFISRYHFHRDNFLQYRTTQEILQVRSPCSLVLYGMRTVGFHARKGAVVGALMP